VGAGDSSELEKAADAIVETNRERERAAGRVMEALQAK
jgi:hypothetical protein